MIRDLIDMTFDVKRINISILRESSVQIHIQSIKISLKFSRFTNRMFIRLIRLYVWSYSVSNVSYATGVCLGDGQTEDERVPSHCGFGDELLRHKPLYLILLSTNDLFHLWITDCALIPLFITSFTKRSGRWGIPNHRKTRRKFIWISTATWKREVRKG